MGRACCQLGTQSRCYGRPVKRGGGLSRNGGTGGIAKFDTFPGDG